MISVFLHGALLSLSLILPLGPQNVFILSQGVAQNSYRNALPSIITAALCDTFLIVCAVFGLSMFFLSIAWLEKVMLAIGSIFLLYYGVVSWKTGVQNFNEENEVKANFSKQILFTLSVSLLNPYAILDTIGVIGTSSFSYKEQAERLYFTIGCISISWLWFFMLAKLGRYIKKSPFLSKAQNKISAVIMFSCFFYLLYRLLN